MRFVSPCATLCPLETDFSFFSRVDVSASRRVVEATGAQSRLGCEEFACWHEFIEFSEIYCVRIPLFYFAI